MRAAGPVHRRGVGQPIGRRPDGEVRIVSNERHRGWPEQERRRGRRSWGRTALRRLAATVKARWSCEQVHQQLKQELGLGDFEGRSWTGLHRHALMTCIAFAYLYSAHARIRKSLGEMTRKLSDTASQ